MQENGYQSFRPDREYLFELNQNICSQSGKIKNPFRLKDDINFHLFISSAPCGDGRTFSLNDRIEDEVYVCLNETIIKRIFLKCF